MVSLCYSHPRGNTNAHFCFIVITDALYLKVEKEEDVTNSDRGRILVSLLFNTNIDQLTIGIKRCAGLAAMDSNGLSDPYVKM